MLGCTDTYRSLSELRGRARSHLYRMPASPFTRSLLYVSGVTPKWIRIKVALLRDAAAASGIDGGTSIRDFMDKLLSLRQKYHHSQCTPLFTGDEQLTDGSSMASGL